MLDLRAELGTGESLRPLASDLAREEDEDRREAAPGAWPQGHEAEAVEAARTEVSASQSSNMLNNQTRVFTDSTNRRGVFTSY